MRKMLFEIFYVKIKKKNVKMVWTCEKGRIDGMEDT